MGKKHAHTDFFINLERYIFQLIAWKNTAVS